MRFHLRASLALSILPVTAFAALAALIAACGGSPEASAPDPGTTGSATPHAGDPTEPAPTGDDGADAAAAPVNPSSVPHVTLTTAVPTGVQCIVVSSATTPTTVLTTTSVTAGTASVTINLGELTPGPLTLTASAYNAACPATGQTASWVADPVSVVAVAGESVSVPLVLHAASTGTATVTFSQPAISIATGAFTTYAVLADGTVRMWGNNSNCGTTVNATPTTVAGVTNAVQVAAGYGYACVVRTDDSVMCWGDNVNSFTFATFAFTGTAASACTAPTIQPTVAATHVSSGIEGVAYISSTGTEGTYWKGGYSWGATTGVQAIAAPPIGGYADFCQLNQEGTAQCTAPSGATTAVAPAKQVFQGWDGSTTGPFSCAILVNGTVECWGYDQFGQLGVGGMSTTFAPAVPVSGLSNVTTMALSNDANGYAPSTYTSSTYANAAHACAVQNGSVLCAGSNYAGQLGNGTNYATTSFTAVPGLTNVTALAAGFLHTCALRTDGSVACWGNNDYGQLGDGTTVTRFTPVTVSAW